MEAIVLELSTRASDTKQRLELTDNSMSNPSSPTTCLSSFDGCVTLGFDLLD